VIESDLSNEQGSGAAQQFGILSGSAKVGTIRSFLSHFWSDFDDVGVYFAQTSKLIPNMLLKLTSDIVWKNPIFKPFRLANFRITLLISTLYAKENMLPNLGVSKDGAGVEAGALILTSN